MLRGIKPPAAFGGRLFIREALDGAAADRLELGGCVRREASSSKWAAKERPVCMVDLSRGIGL